MMRRFDFKISQSNGPLLGLAGLLLVGLVTGLIVGWLWSRVGQDGIREDDYLVMVSLLYDRDRSVPNAQERLAILQDSDVLRNLTALSESYPKTHPEAQTEARALRQLANALGKSPADSKSQQSTSDRSSQGGSGGIWIWLGIALVFVVILGVGGPFALQFAHSTQGRFGLPWNRAPRRRSSIFDGRTVRRPTVSPNSIRTLQRLQRTAVEEPKENQQDDTELEMQQFKTFSPSKSFSSSSPSTSALRFSSRYEFGEDPYDEVHPVNDKISGELIGACGFSAELKLSDEFPGRYYAFSVWAHDYVGGSKLKSVGIVSKWAKSKAPPQLVRWSESGKAAEVVVANPGMRLLIDTAKLAIDVNISSFRYGGDALAPPDSYFSSLVVNFDVKIKSLAEV